MKAKWVSLVTSVWVIAVLLASACAPSTAPAPKSPAAPTTAAVAPTAAAVAPTTAAAVPKATASVSTPAATPKPAASVSTPAATPKPAVEQPRSGGMITRALARDVASFDLQREQGSDASATIFNVYQGLVRLDPNEHDKIASDLAEKWEVSPDGKAYTFKFYKGIKWHDGKPFTTEDAKYSLERMQNPKAFNTIAPRGQALLQAMDTVQVVDEDTVKVTTKYPSASFLSNLASGWIAIQPKSIMVAKGDMRRDCVGTGPFKLKQFNPNISLELTKNTDYYIKGLPYLDGIQFYTIKDGATRFSAFRTKRVMLTHVGST
ncbi:MAG: ABC transporter substrate-binding protein, partial [Chloroflexota bacterium]